MTNEEKRSRIFLCHASEDKKTVLEVYDKLKAEGFDPWLDKKDLLPGQFWHQEIPRAIRSAACMLVFLSKICVAKRGYVQKEFKLAFDTLDEIPEGEIYLIPVRIDDCAIPERFEQIHYCDLFEDDGFSRILKVIESKVKRAEIRAETDGYELVKIPGGTFLMGSPESDKDRQKWEYPNHEVTLDTFYLGRYPITNEEYARYLEANPEALKPEFWSDRQFNQPHQPVVGISWEEATDYCKWAGLTLPTEAQWEYACRAGTSTRFYSGDGDKDLARVGWYDENSGGRLHSVGEKPANAFGLHGMHGNVWEWCLDVWDGELYKKPKSGKKNPVCEAGSEFRVIRGGSWWFIARYCRSAYRYGVSPGVRNWDLGFRPCRSSSP